MNRFHGIVHARSGLALRVSLATMLAWIAMPAAAQPEPKPEEDRPSPRAQVNRPDRPARPARERVVPARPRASRPVPNVGSRALPPRQPPLWILLDTDRDGVLSAKEIRAASKVLRSLDVNSDGQVTARELARGTRRGQAFRSQGVRRPVRPEPAARRGGEVRRSGDRPDRGEPTDRPRVRERDEQKRPGGDAKPPATPRRGRDNADRPTPDAPPRQKDQSEKVDAA